MDIHKHLLILKDKDKTKSVESCHWDGGKLGVKFTNSEKLFQYGRHSVQWDRNPDVIDSNANRLLVGNRQLDDVKYILSFKQHYRVVYNSGFDEIFRKSQVQLVKNAGTGIPSKSKLDYFKRLAEHITLRDEEGHSILEKKYEKLGYINRETALATYIDPNKNPVKKSNKNTIIYPFGINLSQMKAVSNALTNSVSVIEGPPGTGKTQTILSIIANVLMQGKTVAVVSNNNSATANVQGKLEKYDLGFVAAYLGSSRNKKRFVENQNLELPKLERLDESIKIQLKSSVQEIQTELIEMLELKNESAIILEELTGLKTEKIHFEDFFQKSYVDIVPLELRRKLSSKKLLNLWLKLEEKSEKDHVDKLTLFSRIILGIRFSLWNFSFLGQSLEDIIPILQKEYYEVSIEEKQKEAGRIEERLRHFSFTDKVEELSVKSLALLKSKLSEHYEIEGRQKVWEDDLWKQPETVLRQYPVVMCTTYSIDSSLRNMIYDYVIVDESSQVDLLTGTLALSRARNIVVVGDRMQLPNVVTREDKILAEKLRAGYQIPRAYHFEEHSLLSSILEVVKDAPNVLLREHYRCHPKIIQFCSNKFYNNELIIMTKDDGEKDVLGALKTVAGNHQRGHLNQRQIDEIEQSVIPDMLKSFSKEDIGIISPYRAQVNKISNNFEGAFEVDTVHKYQGREKDGIIITTVDNEITEFTDDPNMLNVAISRAKKKIRIVLSDSEQNDNTNIGDFVRYIQYNNFQVAYGKVQSVFDLLYNSYAIEREYYFAKRSKVSGFDSENLLYHMLREEVLTEKLSCLDVRMHTRLYDLVNQWTTFTNEEIQYAKRLGTHVDFLIYRKVDRNPLLVIEVDGVAFHKKGSKQYERDQLKNSILEKIEMPYLRISTDGSGEKSKIRKVLLDLVS